MDLTPDDIASALGVSVDVLTRVLTVGSRAVLREDTQALIDRARATAAPIQVADAEAVQAAHRQHIAPLQIIADARLARHSALFARLQMLNEQANAGQLVIIPEWATIQAELER